MRDCLKGGRCDNAQQMNQARQHLVLRPVRVRGDSRAALSDGSVDAALFEQVVATVCPETGLGTHALAWALDRPEGGAVQPRIMASSIMDSPPALTPGELWIWCGQPQPGAGEQVWDRLLPLLSPEERLRAARFRFAADAWSYAAAHAGLRLMLARLLGCEGQAVRLKASARGKPALDPAKHGAAACGRIHFNLAHTRGMAAIALATRPVGIDVEACRELPDMRDLVVSLMPPETLAAFDTAGNAATRTALFFRTWTLSEAYIKATGEGLGQGLATFAFNQHGPARLLRTTAPWGPPRRWALGAMPGAPAASRSAA